MPSLPQISTLPHSPDSTLTSVLDLLFEPSPPLHTLTLPVLRSTPFPSYDTLIAAIRAQLDALAASGDTATLSEILCSHPRLGEKKVDSEQSRAEQAQLQGGKEEGEMLRKLNEEYEGRFPGLRYVYVSPFLFLLALDSTSSYLDASIIPIPSHPNPDIRNDTTHPILTPPSVFVNARPRPLIMENMRQRIDRGDIAAERREAIEVTTTPYPASLHPYPPIP